MTFLTTENNNPNIHSGPSIKSDRRQPILIFAIFLLSSMVFVLFVVEAEVCNEKRLTGSLLSSSTAAGSSHQKLAA